MKERQTGRANAQAGAANKWADNVLNAKADFNTHLIVGSRGELFDRLLQQRGEKEPLWLDVQLIEDPELGPDTFVWTDGEGATLLSRLSEEQMPTPAEAAEAADEALGEDDGHHDHGGEA